MKIKFIDKFGFEKMINHKKLNLKNSVEDLPKIIILPVVGTFEVSHFEGLKNPVYKQVSYEK